MHAITFIDVFTFFIDGILLLTGYLVKYHSSKYPDTACGYHVGQIASKSEAAWKEANRYYGTLLIRIACVLLVVSTVIVTALSVFYHGQIERDLALFWLLFSYLMLSALVPAIGTIAVTEKHLKKLFRTDERKS